MRMREGRTVLVGWAMALLLAVTAPTVDAQLRPSVTEAPLPQVERRGTGEPALLLIPCGACGWWAFDGFMERNADRYTMFAVTLPGYGATPDPGLPVDTDGAPWHDNAVAQLSRLLDDEGVDDVVVVGHSFGSTIALELAAARPDVVTGVVNLDGGITSHRSWFPDDPAERLRAAAELMAYNVETYADPETWRRFNLPTILDPDRRLLYHGMFMGTSRTAVFQYWRENLLVDLNPILQGLSMPLLDVQVVSPTAADPEGTRRSYEDQMADVGPSDRLHTVWVYETFHQILEHRPEVVDEMVAAFVEGRTPDDVRPDGYLAEMERRRSVPLPAGAARRYVGTYRTVLGPYEVAEADGSLVLRRMGTEQRLVHLGGHRFAPETNPRLTLTFESGASGVEAFRYTSPGGGLDLRGARADRPGA